MSRPHSKAVKAEVRRSLAFLPALGERALPTDARRLVSYLENAERRLVEAQEGLRAAKAEILARVAELWTESEVDAAVDVAALRRGARVVVNGETVGTLGPMPAGGVRWPSGCPDGQASGRLSDETLAAIGEGRLMPAEVDLVVVLLRQDGASRAALRDLWPERYAELFGAES